MQIQPFHNLNNINTNYNNLYSMENNLSNPFLNQNIMMNNNHFFMNNMGVMLNNIKSNDYSFINKKTNRNCIIDKNTENANMNQNVNYFNYILNNDYINSDSYQNINISDEKINK